MEKLYDNILYAQKSIEATNENKQLYIYQHEVEYEQEVLEWNYEDKEVEKPVFDEKTGEPIMVEKEVEHLVYDEEFKVYKKVVELELVQETEIVIEKVIVSPKMVKEEIIDPETGEKKIVEVQAHHTETFTKTVQELLIAPFNYYICIEDNITDGTLNPNYEEEEAEKEKARIQNLKCTKRVFVLMLQELGIDYFEKVEPLINADKTAKLEWELCVELLRSNPLLDKFGALLGITSQQIDNLFKYANEEITLEEFKGIDYSKLTVAELKALCDEKEIEYKSNITKADLIKLLQG